ncbi:MAG: hypothetical protein AAGD11_11465 [Planctomycetota bacterium]
MADNRQAATGERTGKKRVRFSLASMLIAMTVACVTLSLYPFLIKVFLLLAASLLGLFLFLITFQAAVFWLFERFWPLPDDAGPESDP